MLETAPRAAAMSPKGIGAPALAHQQSLRANRFRGHSANKVVPATWEVEDRLATSQSDMEDAKQLETSAEIHATRLALQLFTKKPEAVETPSDVHLEAFLSDECDNSNDGDEIEEADHAV